MSFWYNCRWIPGLSTGRFGELRFGSFQIFYTQLTNFSRFDVGSHCWRLMLDWFQSLSLIMVPIFLQLESQTFQLRLCSFGWKKVGLKGHNVGFFLCLPKPRTRTSWQLALSKDQFGRKGKKKMSAQARHELEDAETPASVSRVRWGKERSLFFKL